MTRGRRSGRTLLAVSTLAFFSTMVARLVISPVIPQITTRFAVSKGTVGIALTGMWAAYAITQFPSGVLGRRFGEKRVVLLSLSLTAAGSLLVAVAPTFLAFAGSVVLLGVGAGLYFSVGASLLTKTFANVGQALGVHGAGGPIGGLVAPIVSVYVGTRLGWRYAVALGAVVAVPVVGLYLLGASQPDAPREEPAPLWDWELAFAVVRRPSVLYTTALAALGFFTWQAYASFFPTFLMQYGGYSPTVANLQFGAVFALSAVGLPLLGRLSDVLGRDVVIAAALLAGAAGYAAYFLAGGLVAAVAGTLLLSVGLSWTGALNARLMDRFTDAERQVGFGFVRSLLLVVSSLGSAATGLLAETSGWVAAYGLVAGILVFLPAAMAANHAADAGL